MFERALVTDAEEVTALHSRAIGQVCSFSYPPEIIEIWNVGRTIDGLREIILIDEFYLERNDGLIDGFVHFNENEIVGLFLRLECIGKGLGRKLFEFAISKISCRPVKILASLNAVEFYKHMGCFEKGYKVERRNDRDIYFMEMQYA